MLLFLFEFLEITLSEMLPASTPSLQKVLVAGYRDCHAVPLVAGSQLCEGSHLGCFCTVESSVCGIVKVA